MKAGQIERGEIVHVEGDSLQAPYWFRILRGEFPGHTIRQIPGEEGFQAYMREQGAPTSARPAVVITEMMVGWSHDENPTPPPPEIEKAGFYRAGIRVAEALYAEPATNQVPVVFLTVLEPEDIADELQRLQRLGGNVTYVNKHVETDGQFPGLIRGLIGRG